MQINQKNWSSNRKKEARYETIISQYRKHFRHSLPVDKQYWTMCGQCATSEGEQLVGSEIWQILKENFIIPSQFYGVENDPGIHDLNTQAFPLSNWINDDFYHAMVVAQSEGKFNPGVVNIDLVHTPDVGTSQVAKILAMLTATTDNVLVIANFVLRTRSNQ